MGLARTQTEGLIGARALPDGSFEAVATAGDVADCSQKLRAYDERLSLVRNVLEKRWEVWRLCEDGESRRVGQLKQDRVPNGDRLLADLMAHDTRCGYDPVAETLAHNNKIDKAIRDRHDDELGEAGDKLAFALGRDLDEPAQDGRLYPLSGRS